MIMLLVGKSASGKDHIAKYISDKYKFKFIVSTTTRPIRDGEEDGVDYHYVSEDKFKELIHTNSLIEYSRTGDKYYGIERSEISEDNMISVVDMAGVRRLKTIYHDRVKVIYLTVPDDVRLDRALKRGSFDQKVWEQRLMEDTCEFYDAETEVDYVVLNLDYDDTIKEIDIILEGLI